MLLYFEIIVCEEQTLFKQVRFPEGFTDIERLHQYAILNMKKKRIVSLIPIYKIFNKGATLILSHIRYFEVL